MYRFKSSMISVLGAAALLGVSLLGALAAGGASVRANPALAPADDPSSQPVPDTLAEAMAPLTAAAPERKLDATLTEWVGSAPATLDWIMVQSTQRLDLSEYGFVHQFTWPAGEEVAMLQATPKQALRIAADPHVYRVDSTSANAKPNLNVPPVKEGVVDPANVAKIGRMAQDAPSWAEAEPAHESFMEQTDAAREAAMKGNGPAKRGGNGPTGWWDVRNGHAASEAWDLGFRGDDVAVAVLDMEVDYAHPDLQGTWRILPEGHPYAGWPEVFDPIVGYLAVMDKRQPNEALRSTRANLDTSRVELYQTSTVTATMRDDSPIGQICVQPRVSDYTVVGGAGQLATIRLGSMDCGFAIPATSKGGTVRYGHHPDVDLAFIAAGASVPTGGLATWPGIIAVDEGAAGVYDTVYVDIDGDKDFTDEKPVRKGDPLAHRDLTNPPDGVTDASGGLFYWISDGVNPFPGSWVWGLEADIPAAGTEVGVFIVTRFSDHGTLCASNVVSQGRVPIPADAPVRFRDLAANGGTGMPGAVNYGMAPNAKMVSIGNVYDGRAGGRAMFDVGWRFAAFGTDKTRTDDDIQITSNSYGWSNEDNDGWDPDSRVIDYYIRKLSPNSSWLYATGNGGAGYGTIAPPSPSAGIDVAANTQYGASGWHSITDTSQITFGDIVPFSNRGPGSTGQNGPDLAANGGYGTGAEPINMMLVANGIDSLHAFGTWGGTSRSTPVAAGAMAVVFQAFKSKHNRWPTWAEARAILKGGTRFSGYDTLTGGAGTVDEAGAARIAAGLNGVYALPDEWSAGGYRGTHHDSFANLVAPGETTTQTFTLRNPSSEAIALTLSAQTLRRIKGTDGTLTLEAEKESSENANVPDYVIPVKKEDVPEGTDLMVFRGRQPMEKFDPDGDFGAAATFNNVLGGSVLQHTDIDGDGKFWDDKDKNGVVGYRTIYPVSVKANWGSGIGEYTGIEGVATVTRQLGGLPFGPHQIAWYGMGCSDDMGNAPTPAQDISEKIALMERGTCTFVDKITNATKFGAIGVVMFTDVRGVVAMGANPNPPQPFGIPGVMIPRLDGLEIRSHLLNGEPVTVEFGPSASPPVGLDGVAAIDYRVSELEAWEFQRFSHGTQNGNTFEISVHHPRERWADGIWLGVNHLQRSPAMTVTELSYRIDAYKYQPWSALTLNDNTLTVPAGGEVTFTASLAVPADAASGVWQGAIFADYARRAGDVPIPAAGGYETPQLRLTIPVVANIAHTYNWEGAISLGGPKGMDMDASYNNGAVRGQQNWNWRPESGDWRFFFVDALKAVPGTYWIFRTQWDEANDNQTDVDTRIWGPADNRYSNPLHPANTTPGAGGVVEDRSDGGWYGPHGMEMKGGSTNRVGVGGQPPAFWPFDTNTSANEEWFAMPSSGGLHEVMLDNVAFGGHKLEVPIETTASALQVSSGNVAMWGSLCRDITITSQMDLPGFVIQGFSGQPPTVTTGSARQDDPQARGTAHLKEDVTLDKVAAGFTAILDAPDPAVAPQLDLDLLVLYDKNADLLFDPATEVVGQSLSDGADEAVRLQGTQKPGDYQVWVHGFTVPTPVSYTLSIQIFDGDAFKITSEKLTASMLPAGKPHLVEICPDVDRLEVQPDPVGGTLVFGPGLMPGLFQVPMAWYSKAPHSVVLPLGLKSLDLAIILEGGQTP
ncbi:MAG: S8 family serine peptidase [Ardenticatenales bacterium]|nr:S8 family serine peptidase [Ardenticatenales bacterium]